MSWFGWLLVIIIFAYCVLHDFYEKNRCYPHGVFGRCRRCQEEQLAKARAEAELRATAERRRIEIEQTYRNMDEEVRNELAALVIARAEREDLLIRPGDLEEAVVRLYTRRHGSLHQEQ